MLHKKPDLDISHDSFSTISSKSKDNLSLFDINTITKNYVNLMDPYTSFKIFTKLMEIYTIGSGLNSAYNSAYLKVFEKASTVYGRTLKLSAKGESAEEGPLFYDAWLTLSDNELDKELKSSTFTSLLCQYAEALVELHSMIRQAGYPVYYFRHLLNLYMKSIAIFGPIQSKFELTPYDIVFTKGKARLLHYSYNNSSNSGREEVVTNQDYNHHTTSQSSSLLPSASSEKQQQQRPPVIITYAPINRFHIMDITPNRSVVRALLSRGLDVYLLDWGCPDLNDSSLSLSNYVNYLKEAVHAIKDKTGIDKISLLAYCWGGIIGTIYAALNNDNLKNLVLMAVPIDSSKDNTIIASWLKTLDVDKVIDEFDSIDGMSLELAFPTKIIVIGELRPEIYG